MDDIEYMVEDEFDNDVLFVELVLRENGIHAEETRYDSE